MIWTCPIKPVFTAIRQQEQQVLYGPGLWCKTLTLPSAFSVTEQKLVETLNDSVSCFATYLTNKVRPDNKRLVNKSWFVQVQIDLENYTW